MPTPCSRKYSRVCAASPRPFSRNVSTATANSPAGSSSASALWSVSECALNPSTRRAAPTAKAMDVMSTSPSGIIAVTDAIVAVSASTHAPVRHACRHPPRTCIWALRTRSPTGPIAQPTQPSTRLIESRSSDPTSENRFASPANALA